MARTCLPWTGMASPLSHHHQAQFVEITGFGCAESTRSSSCKTQSTKQSRRQKRPIAADSDEAGSDPLEGFLFIENNPSNTPPAQNPK